MDYIVLYVMTVITQIGVYKMDNIKKLAKYLCLRCLRLYDKFDYLTGNDGVELYKYPVCSVCKCDKIIII